MKVLTAYELPTPPTPEAWALPVNYFEEMDIALQKQARNSVDRGARETETQAAQDDLSLDAAVVPGSPRSAILDEAESWGADLIVLGSDGYRASQRFLLGSVSTAPNCISAKSDDYIDGRTSGQRAEH